jgi:hypothetical protein
MTKKGQQKAKAKKPAKKKSVAPVRDAAEEKDGGGELAERRAEPQRDIERDAPLRGVEEEGAPQHQ